MISCCFSVSQKFFPFMTFWLQESLQLIKWCRRLECYLKMTMRLQKSWRLLCRYSVFLVPIQFIHDFCVQNSRDIIVGNEITNSFSNETPVAYVGKYLRHLSNDSSVTEYFLYSRSQPSSEIGGKELLPVSELLHMHSPL